MSSYQALAAPSRSRSASSPRHRCRDRALLLTFAALGLASVGLAPGCTCTPIGWYEGLTIDVRSGGPLAEGDYELAIEADGVDVTLGVGIHDGVVRCLPGGETEICSVEVDVGRDRRLRASIDTFGPDTLMVNLHYVDDGADAGGPEVARLRVERDGETIADATFEPDYSREEINGRGCGVATTARVELVLPVAQTALSASRGTIVAASPAHVVPPRPCSAIAAPIRILTGTVLSRSSLPADLRRARAGVDRALVRLPGMHGTGLVRGVDPRPAQ